MEKQYEGVTIKLISTRDFYNRIKAKIPTFVCKNIVDSEIYLFEEQINMLENLLITWAKNDMISQGESLLNDIFNQPNNENGKVYEALVYSWLSEHYISFEPQIRVEQDECFKAKSGYDADGKIIENSIIFDVKQFGLTLPHIEGLRKKLQSKISSEYYLTISNGQNISVKDLQINFFEKADDVAKIIMSSENKNFTDYIYHDKLFGLEFRAWHHSTNRLVTSISEFNLYEWAENNEFYFMYHSSQFCINKPYVLFCPFDKSLVPMFSNGDTEFTFTAFRALCRRIFVHLNRMENRMINEFDGKAKWKISVSTASKKISAIVFMDVSKNYDYKNCRTFVFKNPNADYKIHEYQINSLFRNAGAFIEDFRFDNY